VKAEIIEKILLKDLPSASGIEVINENIYIIGDDSPYLYVLDFNFQIITKIELFKSNDFSTGRIPKKLKADLECMTRLEVEGIPNLLICGSGANSNRENAFLVNLSDSSVRQFSLSGLFQIIKENTTLIRNNVLNIEGLAANQNNIFFFDRENNLIFFYKLPEFIEYITEKITDVPLPSFNHFNLQGLNNISAGFSGADIFDNKIFFTASVEDTPDAISDGAVYGSFAGYLEFADSLDILPLVKDFTAIREKDNIFSGKVESISVNQKSGPNEYLAFVVTDDDLGGSELLRIRLSL
jgi:hypothetical protein